MGTTIVTGIGKMAVTKIGKATRMGQIAASLVKQPDKPTPLMAEVKQLSHWLGAAVGVIAAAIFIVGSFLGHSPKDMFELGVAVAVAAVPEGLAVTLTAILALGMHRILKRKALVRKLIAAETLGSVTTICVDKTGTLTEGKMRVVRSVPAGPSNPSAPSLSHAAILCNDLRDPLEISMDQWARKEIGGKQAEKLINDYKRLDEIAFSPDYKYIATLHQASLLPWSASTRRKSAGAGQALHSLPSNPSCPSGPSLLLVSGAPEVVLEKSALSAKEKAAWTAKFEHFGLQGYRLVAFASKNMNQRINALTHQHINDLTWLGILIYDDPVRAGVGDALAHAQKLGLKIHVITGDYLPTTEAVVRKLVAGSLKLEVDKIIIHARVKPEEKLAIVKELQARGEVVAMTGDGVNDAPALKAADIGIVVSTAADVSKQTADMVLLDNNFATITAAILEGRGIHQNLKKVVVYLMSDAFAEVILIAAALFLPIPLPLLATQILWINLISDGFPALALTVEPHESYRHPARPSFFDRQVKQIVALVSGVTALVTLAAFWLSLSATGNLELSRSIAFAILGTGSLFYVFSIRSLDRPIWQVNPFKNRWLTLAVIAGFILQLLPLYSTGLQKIFQTVPLSLRHWTLVSAAGLLMIVIIESVKSTYYQKFVKTAASAAKIHS
jgi:Ca2+-transporting ATPase